MKKWQENRNYQRIKDENGTVVANIITVDGVDVEVTEEVFLAYSQADRRERYISEDRVKGKVLSLEQMEKDDVLAEYVGMDLFPSAEELYLEQEDACERAKWKQVLPLAVASLNSDEQELIQALFFDGLSVREYARKLGVCHRTIIYRRDKLLKKLRKKFFS